MTPQPFQPSRPFRRLVALAGRDVQAICPLLLLLSREHLGEEEQDRARALTRQFEAWPTLFEVAERLRGLPFVFKHVDDLGLLPPGSDLYTTMQKAVRQSGFHWLTVTAAQARFLDKCLAPADVPHVFFKGLTLSAYYDTPSLRSSRDVDVLVEPGAVETVLDRARDNGYRVLLDPKSALFVESAADLDAVLRLKADIPLLSPEGVVIELHRWLHEDLHDYGIADVIAHARDAEIGKKRYRVLPTGLMFPHLCAHHTRHLWDTPNYIADIAAVRRHPDWDEAEVFDWAGRLGLDHVVRAALDFETETRAGRPLSEMAQLSATTRHFAACFALHAEGTDKTHAVLERELKAVNRWMHNDTSVFREYWTVFSRQFAPTLPDYVRHRVPVHRRLYYWMLGILKVFEKSGKRLFQSGDP